MRHILPMILVLGSLFLLVNRSEAQATCTLSSTNRTVTICTPTNGATVGTTFHVNAGTTDSLGIQYIELYYANTRYVIQHQNFLDATVTVPAGTHQNLTVQAHDTGGVTFKASIIINVASSPYSISPQSPTVSEGATQQFTATKASTWTATCGSITSAGLFTAPLSQPSCKVTGTASDGSGATASTSVNISSPVTVTPSSATTAPNATQQFSANVAVNWTASCGTISTSGLFTAPGTTGTCTITATAASGTPYTDTATDTVTQSTPPPLNYTTWKFDNSRDGLQSHETMLTPSNVNSSSFGPLFSVSLDARAWAQPLYMAGVTVGTTKHNVVYVATANNSLYAIDGDTGAVLWKQVLMQSGETAANGTTVHSSIQPIVGITGTPVIDPSSGTIYLVSYSVNSSGSYFHRLHALSISSGAEKFGGPIVINTGGWDASQHLQRPGLLLSNGNVYIAFSSNEDIEPYHGWVFAYNASTLSQVAVWNATPDLTAGGIWMGASGIAADSSGNLFLSTGNGDWNGSSAFGQSIVELSPTLGVLDYFTPVNHVSESKGDKDLGSGGILLLPTLTGSFPHELVNCSKLNAIYVLNRDHLGELGSTTDNALQIVTDQLGGTSGTQSSDRCFSTPAFWNNNLYFIGNNDVVKQFTFSPSTGMMATTPVHQGSFAFLFPGGQPVVSSNGNNNPILWAVDWTTGTLRAYDAKNVSTSLYTSPKLATGLKFTTPTVINGHVYIGMGNKLAALGLLTGGACAPPSTVGVNVCAPTQGGSYTDPVTVSAAGKPANGTMQRMELWVDGQKINNYYSSSIHTTISPAVGTHQLTAVEVDSAGTVTKSAIVTFTVH